MYLEGHNIGQILFLLSTMLWECISDYRIKFKGQSQSYKKDTGLAIRNHLNKDRALFLFT